MPAFESAPQHEGFEFRAPTLSTGERRRRLAEEACLEELCLYPEQKLRFERTQPIRIHRSGRRTPAKTRGGKGRAERSHAKHRHGPETRGRLLSIGAGEDCRRGPTKRTRRQHLRSGKNKTSSGHIKKWRLSAFNSKSPKQSTMATRWRS